MHARQSPTVLVACDEKAREVPMAAVYVLALVASCCLIWYG